MTNNLSYNHHRPYRERICKIQGKYAKTVFTENAEFWTLGGPEHYEFKYFNTKFKFDNKSYHTVDRDNMISTDELDNKKAVVTYQGREFFSRSIVDCWRSPLVLSYDSTEQLTCVCEHTRHSHDKKILDLAKYSKVALRKSGLGILFVHANYMLTYPGRKSIDRDGFFFLDDFERWSGLFCDQFDGFADVYQWPFGRTEKMATSRTDMLDFHFIIRK